MIDGKTLFDWWEECWPDLPRWGWDNQPSVSQRAFNALAERINLEMGKPIIVFEKVLEDVNLDDFNRPGSVIRCGAIPPGTEIQVPDVMVQLTDEGIKQLSKATFKAAIENTLVAYPPTSNPDTSTHHKSCALRHDGIACTCP